MHLEDGCDVHGRGEGIVAGLAHIHVVVGVNELAPDLPSHVLDCPVGDDFVHVHVRLRAGASLPDDKREVIIELALDDLV